MVVIDYENRVGGPPVKTLAQQSRESRRINLTCVLRAKMHPQRLSRVRDDLLCHAGEVGR